VYHLNTVEERRRLLQHLMVSLDGVSVNVELCFNDATYMIEGASSDVEAVRMGSDGGLVKETIVFALRSTAYTSFRLPILSFSVASMRLGDFGEKFKANVLKVNKVISETVVVLQEATAEKQELQEACGKLKLIVADGHKSHAKPLARPGDSVPLGLQ
jgi:hypothetical protein